MENDTFGDHSIMDRLHAMGTKLLEPEIYVQAIEELPDALVMIKESNIVVAFNKQASYLFGYHPSEVIGQNLRMLIPEDIRDQHDSHLKRFFEHPSARPMGVGLKLTGRHKSGRIFVVQINLSPIIAPSAVYAMAVIRLSSNNNA